MGELNGLFSPLLRARRLAAVPRESLSGMILDMGCGTGSLADQVSPSNYLGVDVDAECLELARERYPGHRFVLLDDFRCDRHQRQFDGIVALAVIEHIEDQTAWLQDLLSRLRPNGQIVMTTPSPKFRILHDVGAKVGLFAHEAAEEHTEFLDLPRMRRLTDRIGDEVVHYRRFLGGANQLFVVQQSVADRSEQNTCQSKP